MGHWLNSISKYYSLWTWLENAWENKSDNSGVHSEKHNAHLLKMLIVFGGFLQHMTSDQAL